MANHIEAAIDQLKQQATDIADEIKKDNRVEQLSKLVSALNGLEELCGVPRSGLATFLNFGHSEQASGQGINRINPDEFYGLEPLEAAKRFLQKRGKPAHIDQIVAGIKSGGGDPGNEKRLCVSLARSTFEIAKVGEDFFGLLDFYPEEKAKRTRKKPNGTKDAEAAQPDAAAEGDTGEMEESAPVEEINKPEDLATAS